MAFAFPRDAPILHFTLRPHVEDVSKRSNVLWPVWGYRVVAPEIRERALNVLQKAVLGLCRAGLRRAQDIGARLHLHVDLAAFVILELQERELLRKNGQPTEEGIEVLREETLEAHRSVAGYVFQDPFSGELLPRFAERLDYAETERDSLGFPILVLGTSGSPRRFRPHVELPVDAPQQPPPDAREILRAARRHRAASRRSRAVSPWDGESEAGEPVRAILVDRVSMVEETPRPFFLSTYLYLPARMEDGSDWHVCDPFGLGAAPWLRRSIEARFDRSPRLHNTVVRLVEGAIDEKVEHHQKLMAELREQAALELARRVPAEVRASPIYDALLDTMRAAEHVDRLGQERSEHELRSVLLAARITLERSLLCIAERHPTSGVWRRLYADEHPVSDAVYVREIYESAATSVGFSVLPDGLAAVLPGQLKSAADRRESWRLRPMIIAALLRAREDMSHPLRAAARAAPRLLEELEAIARAGGQGAHAGDRIITWELAKETVDRLVRVITLLHGRPFDAAQ